MSDSLDPRDDALVARLHALGTQPVDPALQSAHLTAMAGVRSGSAFGRSLAGRLKVGAGVLVGFLLGASGLTTVGAMGPLQPIAATAVEAATPLNVPQGAKDKAAKDAAEKASRLEDGSIGTQRIWDDGCVAGENGKFAGNRGLYLKQERAKGAEALAAAKASDCGKPVAGDEDEATKPESETDEPKATDTEGEKPEAQNDGAGKSDDDHGKATAPGQTKADDAQGGSGKSGDDHGKSGDKGAESGQPDSAGKSGIAPSAPETPAEPTTPEPEHQTTEQPTDQA